MSSHALSKKHVRLIGSLLGILVTYFILRRLFTSWQEIQISFGSLHKRYLALSFIVLLLGQTIHALLTYYSNKISGHEISFAKSFQIWFLSQAGKYLPGGIWLFVSKAKLYKDHGISTSKASFLIFWETMAIVSTALLVSFSAIRNLATSNVLSIIFLFALLLVSGISMTISFWQKIESFFPAAKRIANGLRQINRIQFLTKLFCVAFISWIFVCVSFHLLVLSLSPTTTFIQTFAIFPLSWALGFLTLIAPQGIGPREFALSIMLEPLLGSTDTIAIIVLSRIMWTLSDSLLIFLAYVSKKKLVVLRTDDS